jgi:membrane protein EpsK
VSLAVGLAYTPFLVRSLGVEAYGLVPLSFALVQYFGFLTQTVGSTVNQRLVASLSDADAYNRAFSTATVMSAAVALGLLAVLMAVSIFVPDLVRIPAGLAEEATLLFAAVAISLVIAIAATPLRGVIFAENATYWISISQAIETIVRVLIVVAFFVLVTPSLNHVASAILIASVLGLALTFAAARRLRGSLRFKPSGVDWETGRRMLSTSGGVVLTQFGTMLLVGTDLVIMNLMYGPRIGGAYAAISQWAVALRGLTLSLAAPVTSSIMRLYHAGDRAELTRAVCQSIRLLAAFAALPSGFLAGVSPYLLSVWLGPSFAEHWPLLCALSIPIAFNIVAIPLLAVTLAADRTYEMGIVHVVAGLGFVLAAVAAASLLRWNGVEVAIALAVALALKNWISIIPFAGRLIGNATWPFFKSSLTAIPWTAYATLIAVVFSSSLNPASYFDLAEIGLLTSIVYAAGWMLAAPREDTASVRNELVSFMKWVRSRKSPAT